ncbi:PRTRC system ParB family protein [Novosphingobium album (ex Liu et al. 2023)]|uniref:PRTRC system ParB family protein n=1 Tax=Novosphingobium album (ex Liu et al. 2023) TaxID=3031130 RepID=A0ABT5WQ53_9SPHN|nr:PRTRC system ParB family protein [Novosphingobium album (ex Liu et al. 2023)]MDE8652159.1 PRTRC system ParB family protein [Novosphingobium album (ex Liu et al. 2023)]
MTTPPPSAATLLPLSRIGKGDNPRRYFDRKKHEELVASIRLRGILQPILLRPDPRSDGHYLIVAGERRYRAALEVFGPDGAIPVVIREMTDEEALEAAIDENDVRDDASETEQADAAVRVLAACRNDHAEAARRLGWSRAKLDRRLALADLSETVKLALDERRIKLGHAELLAVIPGDKQDKALETILTSGLDVGKTRDLLMRVTQNLAAACFDKSECTSCPFNSGRQRALFETHVDDGHCTNPVCFQLKTEAYETAQREEQDRAVVAARASESSDDDGADDEEEDADFDGENDLDEGEGDPEGGGAATVDSNPLAGSSPSRLDAAPATTGATGAGVARTAASSKAASGTRAAPKTPAAQSLISRTAEVRQAAWRTALARSLAGDAGQAQTAILVAAMSGTLSQIKSETLTSRASLLVGPSFPNLDYSAQIADIRALPDARAANVLCVIAAAYAKDVADFDHVADLARAFAVDLRTSWQVDKAFLERYTKDEIKFIAQECGLIAHVGAKAFAKLLASKKPDLIAGLLGRPGFDWAGRLPGCMTLDGVYGPPLHRPVEPAAPLPALPADEPITDIAA